MLISERAQYTYKKKSWT